MDFRSGRLTDKDRLIPHLLDSGLRRNDELKVLG